jgi:hypothetical protein
VDRAVNSVKSALKQWSQVILLLLLLWYSRCGKTRQARLFLVEAALGSRLFAKKKKKAASLAVGLSCLTTSAIPYK